MKLSVALLSILFGFNGNVLHEVSGQTDVSSVANVLQELRNLKASFEDLKTENLQLKSRVAALESKVSLRSSVNETFAFYARKTGSMVAGSTETPIFFEDVVLNEGSAYITVNSQFLALYDGIYVFNFQGATYSNSGNGVYGYIIKNGNKVASVASNSATSGSSATQSGTAVAILSLQQGDLIHCSLAANHRLRGEGYSSYSGFMLAQK